MWSCAVNQKSSAILAVLSLVVNYCSIARSPYSSVAFWFYTCLSCFCSCIVIVKLFIIILWCLTCLAASQFCAWNMWRHLSQSIVGYGYWLLLLLLLYNVMMKVIQCYIILHFQEVIKVLWIILCLCTKRLFLWFHDMLFMLYMHSIISELYSCIFQYI